MKPCRVSWTLAIAATMLATAGCRPQDPTPRAAARGADVVLISIDTLRADHATPDQMPTFVSLAARGTVFDHARTVAPLTLPAHASLMTGLYPPQHGTRMNGSVVPPSIPTLAERMQAAGYETAAFVAAYVLNRRFGLARGFAHYDDRIPRDPAAPDRLESERRGAQVVDAAVQWVAGHAAQGSRPIFLWVHLYDPHAPYEPLGERLGLATAPAARYASEVTYADAQVGRLLAALGAAGRSSPLTIVVGDHGESLGDHGEPGHGMLLYESAVRIPLVIAGPGVPVGRRGEPVSLVDVTPTILALAGVEAIDRADGADVLAEASAQAREVYAETEYPEVAGWAPLAALVSERWKLVDAPTPELFDLSSDGAESSNQAAQQPALVARLQERLRQIRAGARVPASRPTPEVERGLRALGYISAPVDRPAAVQAPNPAAMMPAWASFEAATAALTSGDARAARAALAALAKAHPDSALFVTTWARALAAAGQHRDAVAVYRTALARWPTDSALAHDLALSAREAGLADEALAAERVAVASDPSNAMAHNGLGLLLVDASRQTEARAAFERAATLDPTNATYHVNLGNASRADGQLTRAEHAYRAALAHEPAHVDAANGLAVVLVQMRRPAEALPLLERVVAREPGFVEGWLNLGIARQQSGDLAGARSAYRRVLDAPGRFREAGDAARALLAALDASRKP